MLCAINSIQFVVLEVERWHVECFVPHSFYIILEKFDRSQKENVHGFMSLHGLMKVVVSPPFVFLTLVKSTLRSDFQVAAQNCWVKKGGAFTGEVSAEMLVSLDIPWVILGHSERRLLLNEGNEFVGDKVAYALSQGLKVIACIGETLEQRESGSTVEVVAAQTKAIAAMLDVNFFLLGY
ncbi:hypothetical protein ACLOJK_012834 [Asimina triloba]